MAYQNQIDLFSAQDEPDVTYIADFLPDQDRWLAYFLKHAKWNEQHQSRKTVTFGNSYHYQKNTRTNRPMPVFLESVTERIEAQFGFAPNNCLVNYYPDGDHYISFHSDQDTEMQNNTGVAIVSLGEIRNITLRNIVDPANKHHYPLQPGSVIFMADELQKYWQHGVLKQAGAGARISLSFRKLI